MTGIPDERGQRLVTRTGCSPRVGQPDLQQAVATFRTQAAAFRSVMPAGGPASVDGGDPNLDQALTQILKLIGGLHAQLAATIAEHGHGLQRACESAPERS
jgi:alkylation response protein AidB-like acyl-CoA dehydrogenase